MGLARKAAIWTNVVFDEVVFQGGLDWALSTYGLELRHNQILGVCRDSLIIRHVEIFSQIIMYKILLRQTCSCQNAHYGNTGCEEFMGGIQNLVSNEVQGDKGFN